MKKLVIGNWKMDPQTLKEAKKIFGGIIKKMPTTKNVETVVCPPVIFLSSLKEGTTSKKVLFGTQDISREQNGSHTGEVSATQFVNTGVEYVIVGHSERRLLGESDELIALKIKNAREAGLSVVLCVGEALRDTNGEYLAFLRNQIVSSLGDVTALDLKYITIAYEPIWAIGKSAADAMKGRELYEMFLYIKKVLIETFGRTATESIRVIYGGSVTPGNVLDIVVEGHVDGVLPGRASRDSEQFTDIVKIISEIQ